MNIPAIPDAEAGYLAMHFGAVLEQDAAARMRVNAVVVCPYGMASRRQEDRLFHRIQQNTG